MFNVFYNYRQFHNKYFPMNNSVRLTSFQCLKENHFFIFVRFKIKIKIKIGFIFIDSISVDHTIIGKKKKIEK